MGQKNPKGTVSVVNDENRYRLRWRYGGKRYSLNLTSVTKANHLFAKKMALQIETDILNNCFDVSLQRYRPTVKEVIINKQKTMVDAFTNWVKLYRNRDCDIDSDYYLTRQMLKRWGKFQPADALKKLSAETIAAKTYNTRLGILRSFFVWAIKNQIASSNPFEEVKPRRAPKKAQAERTPFSEQEIKQILDAFQKDTFCPSSASIKHSYYYPFVYFIFQLGVRNAEAIGLRVKSLDFIKKRVEISEVLARTIRGTHAAARIRKETKNGKVRQLPIDEILITLLQPLVQGKDDDDLVFVSPKGLAIDDRMFQRRIFRKVLEGLSIQVRVLYACRHTFGSRCIHEGLTPVMTAFLMGNNPETALRNYTHLIELPKTLPSISSNK